MTAGLLIATEDASDPRRALAAYERILNKTGLSEASQRTYLNEAKQYVRWLEEQLEFPLDEVLTSSIVRDQVVRTYKRHLQGRRKATGVQTAMAGLRSLYHHTDIGPSAIKATAVSPSSPKALSIADATKVLHSAEKRGVREEALVALGVHCGLRVSELADLDVDDVWTSAQRGEVHVRHGKGDKQRVVPIPAQARDALNRWLVARKTYRGADRPHQGRHPLFLSREGTRMSVRSIRRAITEAGRAVGVQVAPHKLRHTMATQMVQGGDGHEPVDLVTVQHFLGHGSVTTTARYAKPTAERLAAVVEEHAIRY